MLNVIKHVTSLGVGIDIVWRIDTVLMKVGIDI